MTTRPRSGSTGGDLGLLIGPRGQTLLAVQDLTRLAAQKRGADRRGRLRIDIAGYRERRREALARFTEQVADEVRSSGTARALEPMSSMDRKIVHDAANELDGVETISEGEEPFRRVVIRPTLGLTPPAWAPSDRTRPGSPSGLQHPVGSLEEAAALGFLGPGPVEPHVAHAARFVAALRPTTRVLDLGSGRRRARPGPGGTACPSSRWCWSMPGRTGRTSSSGPSAGSAGPDRVTVVAGRAEELGRSPQWRGRMAAVVARSFGSPSVTAECAAPLLAVGGQLVVSEPPEPAAGRWPAAGLALVGLRGR